MLRIDDLGAEESRKADRIARQIGPHRIENEKKGQVVEIESFMGEGSGYYCPTSSLTLRFPSRRMISFLCI